MALNTLTVEQAKAVSAWNPGAWTVLEAPDGWYAQKGDARLVSTNTRRPRRFRSIFEAINRLKVEIGVTEFRVITADGKEKAA